MLDIFSSIPTQMDYKGQKLAEQIFQGIIIFSAHADLFISMQTCTRHRFWWILFFVPQVIGFFYGYVIEQFGWTVYIVIAGFAVSCLLTLPPWPMYRRNPLKWLPVQDSATDDKKQQDKKSKKHK